MNYPYFQNQYTYGAQGNQYPGNIYGGSYMSQNPMDRLSELQYNAQIRDGQYQNQQNVNGLRVLPVGSIDEARGYLSPNDGSRVYLINNNTDEIYSKQLDFSTGKSIFNVYRLEKQPKEEKEENKYITREECQGLINEYEAIKKELENIKKEIRNHANKSASSFTAGKDGTKSQ